jgi:NAD(P)-dependent dehydrogenase (short-subunit alcohol dehydrogenase family)
MSPNRSKQQQYVSAAVERYGGIDIYLANAGIEGTVQPITDYPLEIFDKVLAATSAACGLDSSTSIEMKKPRRWEHHHYLFSCWIKGTLGFSYVTSKHAVIGMMRTAAH